MARTADKRLAFKGSTAQTWPLAHSIALLGSLFDALPLGVVVLDKAGRVVIFNSYEEQLAARSRQRVLGKLFFEEIAPCMNVRELAGVFRAGVAQGELQAKVEFSFPFPHMEQPRDVIVRMKSFIAAGEPHGALFVEDVSAQRSVERMRETLAQLLVHDMKNPLTAILLNLPFLKDATLPRADVTEIVDDCVDAGRRLQNMVLNLLDISRLETGSFPLTRAATDPQRLIEAVVRDGQAMAKMRGVSLVGDPTSAGPVSIDEASVRRALGNLVENAVRFTQAGERVVVRGALDGDSVVFEVEDRGPGISDGLRERIFEKYVQVRTGDRATSNFGLGLTFVRLVARAHGGEARVTPALPHGATFRISLPAQEIEMKR